MKETRFKQTEIGLVPQEWKVVKLGEIGTFYSNNTLSRDYLSEEGTIRNIHYGDVLIKYGAILDLLHDDTPFINDTLLPHYKHMNIAKDGDIVIADTAEDEAVCKVTELYHIGLQSVVAGLHTMWFRPKPKTFAPKFLGYYLNASVWHNQILPLIQGIKVSSVSKNAVKETLLSLPPLGEQERIAGALSGVDGLLSSLSRLIEKKRALRTSAMQQLLTAKTRLPGFNQPWKEARLGEVRLNIQKGGVLQSKNFVPGKVKVIAGGKAEAGFHNAANFYGKTITISASGANAGYVWLHNEPIYATDCSVITSSDYYDLSFVYYMLSSKQSDIYKLQTGGAQPHVHPNAIKEILCFLPSLPEQQAIAAVLSSMDAEIAALEAKRAKVEALRTGMMQELLTGRIRLTAQEALPQKPEEE